MNELLWELKNVHVSGITRPRLEDVSLEIRAGVTAVVGYSGAGKTTLLNLLTGFEKPDAGTVASHLVKTKDRLALYWVPQTHGLWPHLSVREHLSVVSPGKGQDAAPLDKILSRFDLTEKTGSYPDQLSEGERARLAVARAIATGAAVLVMDEPLVHIDPARLGKYWQAVRDYASQSNMSLVIATHCAETVLVEAATAVCLTKGRVMYAGEVDDLYYRPASLELAEFLGPSNWLSPDEARHWLGATGEDSCCYRPEQIEIRRDDNEQSDHEKNDHKKFVVLSSRFSGSIAEVELLDESSEKKRSFYHRPAEDALRSGDRVWIKTCLTWLICLLLCGCGSTADPQLVAKKISHWSIPNEGSSIPGPRSMTVDGDDNVYVLDTAGRVLVFDPTGKLIRKWKMPEYKIGRPESICIFKDGRIAVADTHYHRIVFFDKEDKTGKTFETMGSFGKEPGQFHYPVAIVQDDQENFYVCEYGGNDRVQKFTVDGKFIKQFGTFGTDPGQFQRPSGLVWHEGKIFVADAINNRVQVFSDSGKFLEVLGQGDAPVALHYPYDIAKSSAGDLFVIEYGAGRVTKFDASGKLLGRFGTTGREKGQFKTPWGLTVDSKMRLRVADTGNRRIVAIEF